MHTTISDIYNFRSIDDLISTSGQPSEAQVNALAHAGCQTIINLALHDDPRYSLSDEAKLVHSLGMEYIHIPVQFNTPGAAELQQFFQAMESHRSQRLHIHCAANMRVSAFVGLYFSIVSGKPPEQAFALMHSIWQPDPKWRDFIDTMLASETLKDHWFNGLDSTAAGAHKTPVN